MSNYVIDASVAIKWFIWEKNTERAHEVLNELTSFFVPDFFLVEIDSVLTKKVRTRELHPKEAFVKKGQLRELPYILINYGAIEEFAFRLATELPVTLYDAAYLATAIDNEATLHTADLRLANGLTTTPFAEYVKYIGK